MRILLTGATGALGSMHVPELLLRGHEVTCIVRGKDPKERLTGLMPDWALERVHVISGDITLENAGIGSEDLVGLVGMFDCAMHHAGSVKFDRSAEDEIWEANVTGTRNMLELATRLRINLFCYDSTAYVRAENARNPYEASKAVAEQLVQKYPGNWMIMRPSIVVGDSRTGVTNSYTGYYGWFSGFSRIKHELRKMWDAAPEAAQGFHFEEQCLVFDEPLLLDYSVTSTLNLVPVDWLVSAMSDLMEHGVHGRIYHLTNPTPPPVAWIIDQSFEILGIQGVLRREAESVSSLTFAGIQATIDERLERYLPYVTEEGNFGCDVDPPPPKIDRDFLEIMLRHACATRFGKVSSLAEVS